MYHPFNFLTSKPSDCQKNTPSLRNDLAVLLKILSEQPAQGRPLGNNFFKTRLAISSKGKGKGKSGGARIITFIKVVQNTIFLVSIYDKSEKSSITDKELNQIFKLIP